MRRILVALAAAATAAAPAASAQDAQKGIRLGVQTAGAIAVSQSTLFAADPTIVPPSVEPVGYNAAGVCGYAAVITPNNRMTVQFGGAAFGTGGRVPIMTIVTCEVSTPLGDIDKVVRACAGGACDVADTTAQWRVATPTICVTVETVYGPGPEDRWTLPRSCDTNL